MARIPPPAVVAARCLVDLAANEDEPEYLTHMRLQKLLYYAQGWSLALRQRPLFADQIQAWAHGPVVPDVYRRLRDKSDGFISPDDLADEPSLSGDDAKFVREVWETYKDYSATRLRKMTHEEPPWLEARKGLKAEDASKKPISRSQMEQYFRSIAA
jgi:uncharacterized phage-associated protein